MSEGLFEEVKSALNSRLSAIISELLPGGRVSGREYICASLQGGYGDSCKTNITSGVGSDFATGESWGDIISLAALVWNLSQFEAAQELANRYNLDLPRVSSTTKSQPPWTPVCSIPGDGPEPTAWHPQYGDPVASWLYTDEQSSPLFYTYRFELSDGKVVLPLTLWRISTGELKWFWRAWPEPRPLYGLGQLYKTGAQSRILIVEGEKTADAAQKLFPDLSVVTWSGGVGAINKTDFSPLNNRPITIWPDNDEPGFKAGIQLATLFEGITASDLKIVSPPLVLPAKWDLADEAPIGMNLNDLLNNTVSMADFGKLAVQRYPGLANCVQVQACQSENAEEFDIEPAAWPILTSEALPGFLGDFVALATEDSEADPVAIAGTFLARFGAEVYGYAQDKGPYIQVGETRHPPRIFVVLGGNSSKARKGTSRYPVVRIFSRGYCDPDEVQLWPLPARESGGPLSTGEGLAFQLKEESPAERDKRRENQAGDHPRDPNDKRLFILDEELASGLSCIKREGNTLSMAIRNF